MNKIGKWIWGLLLIAVGVILALNALGATNIDVFFPGWWTLFIIVPCIIDLVAGDKDNRAGDVVGIVIGGLLLLGSLGVVNFDVLWKLVLPIILVLVGVAVIWHVATGDQILRVEFKGDHRKKSGKQHEKSEAKEAEIVEDDETEDKDHKAGGAEDKGGESDKKEK